MVNITNNDSEMEVDVQIDGGETESIKAILDLSNYVTPEWKKLYEQGWCFNAIANNTLKIMKINPKNEMPLICITVNSNLSLSGKVLMKKLDNHNLVQLSPSISTNSELLSIINYLNNYKLCSGIMRNDFVVILKEKCQGLYCPITEVMRDENCLGLSNCKTCVCCLKLKRNASNTKAKGKANKPKSKKYKSLSKEELIALLKKSKENERNTRKQVKRYQKKSYKHLVTDSEPLPENDEACIEEILKKSLPNGEDNSFVSIFLREQIKMNNQADPRGRRWHPLVIQWCLFQYHKSPMAYKSLANSNILKLPSYTTLFRQSSHDSRVLGFSDAVLNRMKEDIQPETLTPEHQYFNLLLDEMKTKEELVYKKDTGDLVGYTHLNDARNKIYSLSNQCHKDKKVANHVLMLMLRGATTHVKYPFAHFATNSLTADDLNSIVWEAIEKLESLGFKILTIIGDGAAINRKFFSMNTTENSPHSCINPYSLDEERPLYFIIDPPHLLKTVRNCLFSSEETCKVRLMYKNKQNIVWKAIRDLYETERSRPGNFRKAHKLTNDHIYLNSYSKMKVRFAAQVLSKTTANAICAEFGEKYSETVKFIELFDTWFDIFNTSNLTECYYQRKPNKRPFKTFKDQRISVSAKFIRFNKIY